MRPTTLPVNQFTTGFLSAPFNKSNPTIKPNLYSLKRLAIMEGCWEPPYDPSKSDDANRSDCPEFLYHFLTETPTKRLYAPLIHYYETNKRQHASLLYTLLAQGGKSERLAFMQREDVELIPTITLGGNGGPLPQYAKYDLVCPTDEANAMAQLRQAFDDSTREIRGLRLEFGANPIHSAPLGDIRRGVAREPELNMIELKTNPANTKAETEVFRAIGANPKISQLSVEGDLADGHHHGVITALSNPSLEKVEIRGNATSCLRMLKWAADANGGASRRNVWLDIKPNLGYGAKVQNLTAWNAAVVRLAESGSVKSLHLPKEILKGLTPDTLEVARAHQMDLFPIY